MASVTNEEILIKGEHAALRIWRDEEPTENPTEDIRPYETLGYVISGVMELTVKGQVSKYQAGDAYLVPAGASHKYVILEKLTAIESVTLPE